MKKTSLSEARKSGNVQDFIKEQGRGTDMQRITFTNATTCAEFEVSWEREKAIYTKASEWLMNYGDRIGSGTARLPNGTWVDMSKFDVVENTTDAE